MAEGWLEDCGFGSELVEEDRLGAWLEVVQEMVVLVTRRLGGGKRRRPWGMGAFGVRRRRRRPLGKYGEAVPACLRGVETVPPCRLAVRRSRQCR